MKPLVQESVTMATKCSSSATMVTEYNNVSMRSHRGHRNPYASHRKSAVELLEASKGEYVKSSKVLNHKQKLKHPENLCVGNREVISVPLAGKLSPFEDVVTSSQDTVTDKTSCLATNVELQANKSAINGDNQKNLFVTNSESPVVTSIKNITVNTSSSLITYSTNENDLLLSSNVTSISSSKSNSILTTATSTSPKTITSSSSSSSSPTSASRKSSVAASSSSPTSTTSRKSSVPTLSSSPTSTSLRKSSVPTTICSTSTNSNCKPDDDHLSFKKPLPTPSSTGVKPVVPPKPGIKPLVAPKVGPKPVINTKSDKPVPPPRPVRKSSASTKSDTSEKNCTDNTMSSSDKSSNKAFNAHDHKRFSSVSASACETSSKGSDSVDGSKDRKSLREARYSLSSQNEVFLKPICSNNLSTSVGVLVERKRSPIPKPRIDKQLNEIELPPRRPLHRSQSDLSNCRHSRTSSDFSDLSSRLSRTSTEVERFFNEMGIDHSVLEPMRRLSETKYRETLDSVSSLDSLDGQSLSSRLSNDLDRLPMESEQDLSERDPGTTSVVERNARIIKWLCNVKKARTVQTKHANRKS
ncbi:hypothetical protein ACF0H5_004026 [Mactra antiquata]